MDVEERLESIGNKLASLLPRLPDTVGRGRAFGIYQSFLMAKALDYEFDQHRILTPSEKDNILQHANYLDPSSLNPIMRNWLAGYYFNNALLRLAAASEVALKKLFEFKTGQKPPKNKFYRLLDWYRKEKHGEVNHLVRARQEINDFKHVPQTNVRKLETMEDGVLAFEQFLMILEHISEGGTGDA